MVWVIVGVGVVWLRSGLKHFSGFLLHNLQDIPCIRQAGLTWNLKEHPAVEEIEGLVESLSRPCELQCQRPWKRNPEILRPLIRHPLQRLCVFLIQPREEPVVFLLEPWILPRAAKAAGNWSLVGKAACPIGRIGVEGEGDPLGVFLFDEKVEALEEKLTDKRIGFSFKAFPEWKLALGVVGGEGGVHGIWSVGLVREVSWVRSLYPMCGLALFDLKVKQSGCALERRLTRGGLKHGANSEVMLTSDDEGVHSPAGVHRDCFHSRADAQWPLFKWSCFELVEKFVHKIRGD